MNDGGGDGGGHLSEARLRRLRQLRQDLLHSPPAEEPQLASTSTARDGRPIGVDDLRTRQCWICLEGDDGEDSLRKGLKERYRKSSNTKEKERLKRQLHRTKFIHPCSCLLVVHEKCLVGWVQRKITSENPTVSCPQCASPFEVTSPKSLPLRAFESIHAAAWYARSLLPLNKIDTLVDKILSFGSLRLWRADPSQGLLFLWGQLPLGFALWHHLAVRLWTGVSPTWQQSCRLVLPHLAWLASHDGLRHLGVLQANYVPALHLWEAVAFQQAVRGPPTTLFDRLSFPLLPSSSLRTPDGLAVSIPWLEMVYSVLRNHLTKRVLRPYIKFKASHGTMDSPTAVGARQTAVLQLSNHTHSDVDAGYWGHVPVCYEGVTDEALISTADAEADEQQHEDEEQEEQVSSNEALGDNQPARKEPEESPRYLDVSDELCQRHTTGKRTLYVSSSSMWSQRLGLAAAPLIAAIAGELLGLAVSSSWLGGADGTLASLLGINEHNSKRGPLRSLWRSCTPSLLRRLPNEGSQPGSRLGADTTVSRNIWLPPLSKSIGPVTGVPGKVVPWHLRSCHARNTCGYFLWIISTDILSLWYRVLRMQHRGKLAVVDKPFNRSYIQQLDLKEGVL